MNKFILGGILAAISLMAIYGTSASNQVISRVDGTDPTSTQSNFGPANSASGGTAVALNPDEASEDDSFVEVSAQTPLEKAGTIPQRQTVGTTPNFGATATNAEDDTDGEIVEPAQPEPEPPATPVGETAAPGTPAPAAPAQAEEPIRALW
ncbi:MAG: hypothetical protein AAFR24_16375 [Cyanobacteria bacterium J06627_3]